MQSLLICSKAHNALHKPTFAPFRLLGFASQIYPNKLHSENAAYVGRYAPEEIYISLKKKKRLLGSLDKSRIKMIGG